LLVEAKEIEAAVGDLETNLDRLRSLYEQYFMGIERIAPAVVHKDVERRLYALRKEQIRNTAVRFRFQMIIQRYSTYQAHWQRICRQIEEGTYERHLLRAQKRFAPSAAPPPEPQKPGILDSMPPASVKPLSSPPPLAFEKLELDDLEAFADLDLSKAAPPKSAPKPPPLPPKKELPKPPPVPPRPVAPQPGLSDDRIKQIYSQYVEARRSQKDGSAPLSYDAIAKSIRDSSSRLREKHGNVDFEVAVKDGKAILRAVVKKPAPKKP
jgi:hypothetical protein